MAFIAGYQTAKVLEPGEEAFDLPPTAVAAQRPTVLRLAAPRAVRRDQLDAALGGQLGVELVRIVGLVADQTDEGVVEEGRVEGLRDERDFAGARTCDSNGERKTTAVCDCHDLGPFALPRGADAEPPFFAPA